jgi:hypothetical protein
MGWTAKHSYHDTPHQDAVEALGSRGRTLWDRLRTTGTVKPQPRSNRGQAQKDEGTGRHRK